MREDTEVADFWMDGWTQKNPAKMCTLNYSLNYLKIRKSKSITIFLQHQVFLKKLSIVILPQQLKKYAHGNYLLEVALWFQTILDLAKPKEFNLTLPFVHIVWDVQSSMGQTPTNFIAKMETERKDKTEKGHMKAGPNVQHLLKWPPVNIKHPINSNLSWKHSWIRCQT